MKKAGKRPVEWLDEIGFLGGNVVAAHCVWLTKKEMDIIAKYVQNLKGQRGQSLSIEFLREYGFVGGIDAE